MTAADALVSNHALKCGTTNEIGTKTNARNTASIGTNGIVARNFMIALGGLKPNGKYSPSPGVP
jgi:hypothetical protein